MQKRNKLFLSTLLISLMVTSCSSGGVASTSSSTSSQSASSEVSSLANSSSSSGESSAPSSSSSEVSSEASSESSSSSSSQDSSNSEEVDENNLSPYELYKHYHPSYGKSEEEWVDEVVRGTITPLDSHLVKFIDHDATYLNVVVRKGKPVLTPKEPTMDEASFYGWYLNNSWYDFDTPVNSNITLVSKYQGSVSLFIEGTLYKKIEALVGQTITLPTLEKKNGLSFLGWKEASQETLYNGSYTIKKNIRLEASYETLINPDDKEEALRKFDPFFPTPFEDTPYILNPLPLEGRFFVDQEKGIATLFAPGVTSESGFFDADKTFRGDTRLCWAASCSNLIAWYVNQLKEQGVDTSMFESDSEGIFNQFKASWDGESGYDFTQGLAWYFTGKTTDGKKPDNLFDENSGGFLRSLPHVGDSWATLDAVNHFPIMGNYQEMYPFMQDQLDLGNNINDFTKLIFTDLHYGPSALMITWPGGTATGSHAITLWGAEFSLKNHQITKIYVTDSDDEQYYNRGNYLNPVKVVPSYDGFHGVELVDYNLGGPGDFKFINASLNLFAPNVVSKK